MRGRETLASNFFGEISDFGLWGPPWKPIRGALGVFGGLLGPWGGHRWRIVALLDRVGSSWVLLVIVV